MTAAPALHPPMVEASGLRKSYGAGLVLESMTLTIRAGEIVGLLGPNGAVQTTTLSITRYAANS